MQFVENCKIYYINLDTRTDRDAYFKEHLHNIGVTNYERISADTPVNISDTTFGRGTRLGVTPVEMACSSSHLRAIKQFVDSSTEEFAVFCEDDADLTNLTKLRFSIEKLLTLAEGASECVQLGVSTREDVELNFSLHERAPWDFNTSTYVLSRTYALVLLDRFYDQEGLNLDTFAPTEIFDYRNSSYIKSTPVSEYTIYGIGIVLSIPLCTYNLSPSSIQASDETDRQNLYSKTSIDNHWAAYAEIHLDDLLKPRGL